MEKCPSLMRQKKIGISTWSDWRTILLQMEFKQPRRNEEIAFSCQPYNIQTVEEFSFTQKPTEKTYEELVAVMKAHHCPNPSVIVQRFRFHNRFRHPGESISAYIAELRALSEYCNFTELEDMLRDRLVCGMNDEAIQRKLLAEPELTYARATEIAISMETALKNSQLLQNARIGDGDWTAAEPRDIYQLRTSDKQNSQERTCHRCGKPHLPSVCRFRLAKCHNCGKIGHIKSVC